MHAPKHQKERVVIREPVVTQRLMGNGGFERMVQDPVSDWEVKELERGAEKYRKRMREQGRA